MRIKNLILALSVSLVAITSEAKPKDSNEPPLIRSVTLTPGYMERTFNSNEMMKHGPLSLMQLYSKGTDELCAISDNVFVKLGIFGLCLIPNYYFIADTSHIVYHEFGHARAAASMGYEYFYYAASGNSLPTDYAYGIYLERIENPSAIGDGAASSFKAQTNLLTKIPSSLLRHVMTSPKEFSKRITRKLNSWWKNPKAVNIKVLTPQEKYILDLFMIDHNTPSLSPVAVGSTFTSEAEVSKTINDLLNGSTLSETSKASKTRKQYQQYIIQQLLSAELDIVIDFAGINNQMRYAQEVANIIFKHNGHQMYCFDYLWGKYEPYRYTTRYESHLATGKVSLGNDIYYILLDYDNRGYNIDTSDIKKGSLASLFLSSTTWAFVYSAITELPKGSFLVHAPVWHGWRLPDLNFYMTSQGLSFEVVTGYQFNESWYAGLTAEMVYKGNTAYEFGPSVGYKFNTPSGEFELSAQAIIGKDMEFGGNAGIEWTSPRKDWTVGLKYIYHNALTLVGERNIPFLCSGFMSDGEPSHTNHEANITVSYNY